MDVFIDFDQPDTQFVPGNQSFEQRLLERQRAMRESMAAYAVEGFELMNSLK